MMHKKKIVIDVDGVLVNFQKKFMDLAFELYGTRIKEVKAHKYDLAEQLGVSRVEEALLWKVFNQRGYWRELEPLDGAVEAVAKIKEHGYKVYIVTAIDKELFTDRQHNLNSMGIYPDEMICVGGPHGRKDHDINRIKPDVFIDDRLDHLHRVQNVHHLVLVDAKQEQFPIGDLAVDVKVDSIKQWVDEHLLEVTADLNVYYGGKPIQKKLRFI